MYESDKDVVLSNNPTQKEIAFAMNNMFKSHWNRGYSYVKSKPKSMRSKQLPGIVKQPLFAQYATYMQVMADSLIRYDFFELDPNVSKELSHWDNKGGYCIYMSILFYGLLVRNSFIPKQEVGFFQGHYDFQLREDMPSFIPLPKRQLGLHAWLTINGSVVDLTANQNMRFFDFGFSNLSIILGEYPNGYKLVGYEETEETIEWYLRHFSSYMDMSVDEWLEFHHNESAKGY